MTLGQDVVDYLRTLPEHYDGVVSGEVIYIAGDGYDLTLVPGTDNEGWPATYPTDDESGG